MKRLVMFCCVLFLMFDLADDGCLGEAKFVNPPSPVESLEVSSSHSGSEAPDCPNEILRGAIQLPLSQWRRQPTKPLRDFSKIPLPKNGRIS
jgi:hypothetical protein